MANHAYAQFLIIEVPVFTAMFGGAIAWWIQRIINRGDTRNTEVDEKLDQHSQSLALLLQQVMPPGQQSLRDMVVQLTAQRPNVINVGNSLPGTGSGNSTEGN